MIAQPSQPPIRPSTRQLGAAWLTGALLVIGAWWAFSTWESGRNTVIQSNLNLAKTMQETAGAMPDSATRWKFLGNAGQFQNLAFAETIEFSRQRQAVHPLVMIFMVLVILGLLGLTWRWANNKPSSS